jgi:hypothetical protein
MPPDRGDTSPMRTWAKLISRDLAQVLTHLSLIPPHRAQDVNVIAMHNPADPRPWRFYVPPLIVSERLLALLVVGLTQRLITWLEDPKSKFEFCADPQFEAVWGGPASEFPARPLEQLRTVNTWYRRKAATILANIISDQPYALASVAHHHALPSLEVVAGIVPQPIGVLVGPVRPIVLLTPPDEEVSPSVPASLVPNADYQHSYTADHPVHPTAQQIACIMAPISTYRTRESMLINIVLDHPTSAITLAEMQVLHLLHCCQRWQVPGLWNTLGKCAVQILYDNVKSQPNVTLSHDDQYNHMSLLGTCKVAAGEADVSTTFGCVFSQFNVMLRNRRFNQMQHLVMAMWGGVDANGRILNGYNYAWPFVTKPLQAPTISVDPTVWGMFASGFGIDTLSDNVYPQTQFVDATLERITRTMDPEIVECVCGVSGARPVFDAFSQRVRELPAMATANIGVSYYRWLYAGEIPPCFDTPTPRLDGLIRGSPSVDEQVIQHLKAVSPYTLIAQRILGSALVTSNWDITFDNMLLLSARDVRRVLFDPAINCADYILMSSALPRAAMDLTASIEDMRWKWPNDNSQTHNFMVATALCARYTDGLCQCAAVKDTLAEYILRSLTLYYPTSVSRRQSTAADEPSDLIQLPNTEVVCVEGGCGPHIMAIRNTMRLPNCTLPELWDAYAASSARTKKAVAATVWDVVRYSATLAYSQMRDAVIANDASNGLTKQALLSFMNGVIHALRHNELIGQLGDYIMNNTGDTTLINTIKFGAMDMLNVPIPEPVSVNPMVNDVVVIPVMPQLEWATYCTQQLADQTEIANRPPPPIEMPASPPPAPILAPTQEVDNVANLRELINNLSERVDILTAEIPARISDFIAAEVRKASVIADQMQPHDVQWTTTTTTSTAGVNQNLEEDEEQPRDATSKAQPPAKKSNAGRHPGPNNREAILAQQWPYFGIYKSSTAGKSSSINMSHLRRIVFALWLCKVEPTHIGRRVDVCNWIYHVFNPGTTKARLAHPDAPDIEGGRFAVALREFSRGWSNPVIWDNTQFNEDPPSVQEDAQLVAKINTIMKNCPQPLTPETFHMVDRQLQAVISQMVDPLFDNDSMRKYVRFVRGSFPDQPPVQPRVIAAGKQNKDVRWVAKTAIAPADTAAGPMDVTPVTVQPPPPPQPDAQLMQFDQQLWVQPQSNQVNIFGQPATPSLGLFPFGGSPNQQLNPFSPYYQ